MARNRRVVRIDLRRSGLSDRDVVDCSLDAYIRDVAAVADRVGFDRIAIDAASSAALVAIAFAARHPQRVSHLVLTDGWIRGSGEWDTPRLKAVDQLAMADWQLGTDALALWRFGWTENARIGEPIAEGDNLFGNAVILAARVADQAAGGQVLVADVCGNWSEGRIFSLPNWASRCLPVLRNRSGFGSCYGSCLRWPE